MNDYDEGLAAACDSMHLDLLELQRENESLSQLLEDQESSMQHEITLLAEERDEWKCRLHEYKKMLESLPGSVLAPGDGILPQPLESISYHEAIRRKYPEVDYWFED